jgi:hypothetical protein
MNHRSRRSSLRPVQGANSALRQRLDLKGELALAAAPTLIVLIVLAFVEVLSRQRLLFASLASGAFLIYLDPQHGNPLLSHLLEKKLKTLLYLGFTLLSFSDHQTRKRILHKGFRVYFRESDRRGL